MKVIKLFICFASLFVAATTLWAHEEPVKTLKEKSERESYRQKISKAGIKRIVTYEQSIVEGKEAGRKSKVMVQEFDRNGAIISLETFKDNKADVKVEYSYDKDLNIAEQKAFTPASKLLDRDVFDYDKEGRVVSGKTYNEKNEVFETFKYLHSPDRKKITFIKYKNKPEPDYRVEYTYANDYDRSDSIEIIKLDAEDHVVLKVREERDADGFLTDRIIYDKDLRETRRLHHDYDENGNIIKMTAVESNQTNSYSKSYTRDERGICTEERKFAADGKLVLIIRHNPEPFTTESVEKTGQNERKALRLGEKMKISEITPIAELSAHPERWFNRDVRIEGIIASACTQEGCFIEVVPSSGPGEGILVNFADSELKFPTDCAGRHVVVEGMFYQKIYPASRVAHWQGHSFREGKRVPPFSLIKRLIATAAELGKGRSDAPLPPACEIFAAGTNRIDLSMMEFESDGFGAGRKVLQPGEITKRHSTGRMRELIFCLEGAIVVHLDEAEPIALKAGETAYIPSGTQHELRNSGTEPCVYIFVFSKADEQPAEATPHAH